MVARFYGSAELSEASLRVQAGPGYSTTLRESGAGHRVLIRTLSSPLSLRVQRALSRKLSMLRETLECLREIQVL